MHSRFIKTIITLSLFVMMVGNNGKAQTLTLSVKLSAAIPFDFKVGDRVLAAGEYDLTNNDPVTRLFQIRSENRVATQFASPMYGSRAREQSLLIFNKYQEPGGEVSYFLAKIWVAGNGMGFEFPKTRVERAVAERAARRDLITLVVQRAHPHAE